MIVIRPGFGRDGVIGTVLLIGGLAALALSVSTWLLAPIGLVLVAFGGWGLVNLVRGVGTVRIDRSTSSVSVTGGSSYPLDRLVEVEASIRMVMTGGIPHPRGSVILDFGSSRALIADRIGGDEAVELARAVGDAISVPVRLPASD
ncbi:MAG TPA: hypothetical protein VMW08_12225 [Acidimicrobiales bacterium]|nr:hypothetical protein [Acidimicrobiales bacterium]